VYVFVLILLLSSLLVDYLPASTLYQYYNVSLTTLTSSLYAKSLTQKSIIIIQPAGSAGNQLMIEMLFRRFASTTPRRLQPTIRQLLTQDPDPQTILSVTGHIKSVRKQKRVSFAAVNDGSCPEGLQAVLSPDDAHAFVMLLFLLYISP
jgi:hypothetical protein